MKIEQGIKLGFDDVLIKPKRSESASRANVSIEREFHFKYSPRSKQWFPIMAANMDTCGSIGMAKALWAENTLVALHKFYLPSQLSEFFCYAGSLNSFYTLGINDKDLEKFKTFNEYHHGPPELICIDVANGYTKYFVDFCAQIREAAPMSIIMAGNVCTPEMTQEIIINGKADIVKIGIGPGSVCTTRLITGVGYPQLSAIAECADVAHGLDAHICADGGLDREDKICKAFGAGADFCMLGGMLAGTDECEGKWTYNFKGNITGHVFPYTEDDYAKDEYKHLLTRMDKHSLAYHGMSSEEAMNQHSGGMADYKAAEGIEIIVPYKGSAIQVIRKIKGAIRSSCSLIGADSLKDHPKCCTFVQVNRIK